VCFVDLHSDSSRSLSLSVVRPQMPATLSPFRYLRLARYIFQRWLNSPLSISAARKGKQRAFPRSRSLTTQSTILRASVEETRPSADSVPSRIPVAGPSARREPLRPDPRFPTEPNEIYRLMNDERLLVPGAAKPPREIVVLCHGRLPTSQLPG